MMPELFDIEVEDPNRGWNNIRLGEYQIEVEMRNALERLWLTYEPYADVGFRQSFAREPDARFWEMYLTVWLLNQGKNVVRRDEIRGRARNHGPDIQIIEDGRNIWIECITPERGDLVNLDRVQDPMAGAAPMEIRTFSAPRREVELRISSALLAKRNVFENYLADGIVFEDDVAIVAISPANFFGQSSSVDWNRATTAVYPIGELEVVINTESREVVRTGYTNSRTIPRTEGGDIPRTAFLSDYFAQISGIIWSRITIGNFEARREDICLIHNHVANRPLPDNWTDWPEEVTTQENEGSLTLNRQLREATG